MIKVSNLSYKYSKDNIALKNINLEIKPKEIVMVIGKNGAGKSTLLSCLANIYKYDGSIYLDERNIKKIPNKEFRREVGIVFQNPNNQIIFPSVRDDTNFVLNNLDLHLEEKDLINNLKLVSMEDYLDHNPYNLSMGQKQRICLSSVLITKPKYLLLDEITAMLDYQGKKDIYKIILDLKKQGIGIVMGTNILDELVYADKIVILDKEIKKVLTRKELLKNINILLDYGFNIPFNLKVINKLKLDIKDYNEEMILEHIHE